ncbi:ermin isoform 2-T2 [Morphnus guianensis]
MCPERGAPVTMHPCGLLCQTQEEHDGEHRQLFSAVPASLARNSVFCTVSARQVTGVLGSHLTPGILPEKQEENDGTLQQGSADIQDTGTDSQDSEEGPGGEGTPAGSGERELGMAAGPGGEVAETLAASADGRGNAAEEEEEEEEEEDTEEDEVQVIEIKNSSEESHPKQQDSDKEASPATSPGCNSQVEKPGEQPSLGKKNDISRHSYSRYNTISYRRIRKGNTKQRIDEFESMMHL